MVEKYFNCLLENTSFKLLLIFIVFDIIFGILRAIKERKINSTIGIDGMIRKVGMIISTIFLFLVDRMTNLNFIGFLPEEVLNIMTLKFIGIGDLFDILFIVFESLSILKNMYLCNLPIPKKLKDVLRKILTEFTEEVKERK